METDVTTAGFCQFVSGGFNILWLQLQVYRTCGCESPSWVSFTILLVVYVQVSSVRVLQPVKALPRSERRQTRRSLSLYVLYCGGSKSVGFLWPLAQKLHRLALTRPLCSCFNCLFAKCVETDDRSSCLSLLGGERWNATTAKLAPVFFIFCDWWWANKLRFSSTSQHLKTHMLKDQNLIWLHACFSLVMHVLPTMHLDCQYLS